MGLSAIIFLFLLLSQPAYTVKINKPNQIISVREQSLIKYNFTVYSFNELSDELFIKEIKGGRSGNMYQLIMPLQTGQKIILSTAGGSKRKEYVNAVDAMNSYIFNTSKQIPFKLTVLDDD